MNNIDPMSATLRYGLLTAVAPILWGTTYYVTRALLPADSPLWGGAIRAVVAGLILIAVARRVPHGSWWWKATVVGILTMGGFFALVYLSAQLLPTSVATTIMAGGPMVMILAGWAIVHERPTVAALIGGMLGILGVVAIVAAPVEHLDPWGIVCAAIAMVISSVGFVLARRWRDDTPVLATTSWQLLAGGAFVTILALVLREPFPRIVVPQLIGYGWIAIVGGALAYFCWFAGLAKLPVAAVGVIALLNPITGVIVGVLVAGEQLSVIQGIGIAVVLFAVVLGQLPGRTPASSRRTRAIAEDPGD
jgi:probable blue pigment (indigoidine) exporter